MKADIPGDEGDRLATLRKYQVLDSPREQDFDDLTLIAAQVCEVPIALVSLIDENRQWIKASVGMELTETPRDIAFCAHTLLCADQVVEVRDAKQDQRFRDNPMVTSTPHVRFYAGAPLLAPDGHALGALCVMDQKPRTLTPSQVEALRALSRQVVGRLEMRRQTRDLANEVGERRRAEAELRVQYELLELRGKEAERVAVLAEKSRRALLSILEDEKRSAHKLRESEERFRQLAENITEVFWMTDPAKGTILYVSPAYEAIWGKACESLYARPMDWVDSIHPEDRARVLEATATRQVIGDYNEVYRIVRPSGSERWVRDRAYPVKNDQGEVYRMVGTAQDITENKRAELRATVEHAVTGVLAEGAPLIGTAHKILEVVCGQLDWSVGDLWILDRGSKTLRCIDVWHPSSGGFESFAGVSRTMTFSAGEGLPGRIWAGGSPQWITDIRVEPSFSRRTEATELRLCSALAFPIKLRNQIFGVVEFFSTRVRLPDPDMLDMFGAIGTQIGQFVERKQLEEQFRQAQKMEAIGTLAGGIAHDFNNVLAAITGYTEMAKMESSDPDIREYLGAVMVASGRAADLVRQILSFSRRQEQQRSSIQLWVILDEALKLLRATIPATIAFEISMIRRGPTVLADPTQVHQVMMNMVTNAAHAMKDRAGRLTVTLEDIQVDEDLVAIHPGLRPGKYLRLAISDTGHGMDEATVSRIFDPFFTTKAPGEGTGLGLAVVHGIMQSHDGLITVYSQPGEGTRFHLYFPAESSDFSEAEKPSSEPPRGNSERILFVDDELPLAKMGQKILERLGYAVDCHTAAGDALSVVRANPKYYDVVVTDLTMPGMTGIEFSQELLRIRSDLPIILITGYSATFTLERVRSIGIREMVLKPLTIQRLGEVVHRLIGEMHAN